MNMMDLRYMKFIVFRDKKYISAGMIIYFLFLVLAVFWVLWRSRNYSYGGGFSFQILDIVVPLSFPAIISSFIISFFSKKHITGIFTVLFSGIIVFCFLSGMVGIQLLREPSSFNINLFLVYYFSFGLFFILPTIIFSGIFTVLFSYFGSKAGINISNRKMIQNTNDS